MAAYLWFDVEILDQEKYGEYMQRVKPLIEAAGGTYLARGGAFKVYEGDYQPNRIVLFRFPDMAAIDEFYNSPAYSELKDLRHSSSRGRFIALEGYE